MLCIKLLNSFKNITICSKNKFWTIHGKTKNVTILHKISLPFSNMLTFPRFFFEPEQFFIFWKGTGLIFNSKLWEYWLKTCKWLHKKAISANKKNINQRLSRACIVHLVIKKNNWSYVKTMSCVILELRST